MKKAATNPATELQTNPAAPAAPETRGCPGDLSSLAACDETWQSFPSSIKGGPEASKGEHEADHDAPHEATIGVPHGVPHEEASEPYGASDSYWDPDWDSDSYCPGGSHDLVNPLTGEIVGRIRCGCRNCSVCGLWLRGCHVAHFTEAFRDRDGLIAFTGGLDPSSITGSYRQQVALLGKMLSRFMANTGRWLRRRSGAKMTYVAAIESDENGRLHFHALVSFPLEEGDSLEGPEALRRRWFQQGGGLVMKATPIEGGERGLAKWIGYLLKGQFGTNCGGHRIRASRDVGYYTEAATERRRAFVEPDARATEEVVLDARFEREGEPEGECDGFAQSKEEGSTREPVVPARLDAGRRIRRYVERVGEGPFGVRVRVLADDTLRYDVVRRIGDPSPGPDPGPDPGWAPGSPGSTTYATQTCDLRSMARAEAEATGLALVMGARFHQRGHPPHSEADGESSHGAASNGEYAVGKQSDGERPGGEGEG